MNLIQLCLGRRQEYLLADRSIIAKAAGYQKFLHKRIRTAIRNLLCLMVHETCRMKNHSLADVHSSSDSAFQHDLHKLCHIFVQIHITDHIIAGSAWDQTDTGMLEILDAIDRIIYGAIPANQDDADILLQVGCQLGTDRADIMIQ